MFIWTWFCLHWRGQGEVICARFHSVWGVCNNVNWDFMRLYVIGFVKLQGKMYVMSTRRAIYDTNAKRSVWKTSGPTCQFVYYWRRHEQWLRITETGRCTSDNYKYKISEVSMLTCTQIPFIVISLFIITLFTAQLATCEIQIIISFLNFIEFYWILHVSKYGIDIDTDIDYI